MYSSCRTRMYKKNKSRDNRKCRKHHRKIRKPTIFIAKLNGRNEVLANDSIAKGNAFALLSKDNKILDYILRTEKLENIVAAHFHDGAKGQDGPIVKDINIDPITGIAIGSWAATDFIQPLTKELVRKLKHGEIYINVHTLVYPGGEIRGQLYPLEKKNKRY